jgi:hypothetical protein
LPLSSCMGGRRGVWRATSSVTSPRPCPTRSTPCSRTTARTSPSQTRPRNYSSASARGSTRIPL